MQKIKRLTKYLPEVTLSLSTALTFAGYNCILILVFSYLPPDTSRSLTVPIRQLILVALAVYFLINIKKARFTLNTILFATFTIIYTVRIVVDSINDSAYIYTTKDLYLYLLSFAVIPYFALSTVPLNEKSLRIVINSVLVCLLYTSPSPRDGLLSRMPSSA